jgi:tRNA U34 2-thiouridine synthase MnmA/TrmU|tara:strand:+ start:414 stop:770 length:357 start_codon:yes stop_codon:yes gene_type:complete
MTDDNGITINKEVSRENEPIIVRDTEGCYRIANGASYNLHTAFAQCFKVYGIRNWYVVKKDNEENPVILQPKSDLNLDHDEIQKRVIIALNHYKEKDPEDTVADTALGYFDETLSYNG